MSDVVCEFFCISILYITIFFSFSGLKTTDKYEILRLKIKSLKFQCHYQLPIYALGYLLYQHRFFRNLSLAGKSIIFKRNSYTLSRCFKFLQTLLLFYHLQSTAQKKKFFMQDFLSKCDQICRKLQIWSHLLIKSLMEKFFFCSKRLLQFSLVQSFSLMVVLALAYVQE